MGTQTVNQNTTTTSELPAWYTAYLSPILQNALSQSQAPYQAYTGPTVAGLTPDQLNAYSQIRDNQGGQFQYLNPAADFAKSAGDVNSGAAGAGQFGQAQDIFGRVAGEDTQGISQPFVNQGTDYLRQSAEGSALDQANPYISQSVSPTGLGAASPYLQQAVGAQGLQAASPYLNAAAGSFPGSADEYMNPYNRGVTDRIAELGARNLGENLLPQINDQFVRAGQYGSPQQRQGIYHAVRDTQDSILGQQAQVLQQGYGQAGQLYEQDAARQAQLAGTAGGLGTAQQQALLGAGSTFGNLGQGQQQSLLNAGTAIGSLSSSDLSRLAAAGINIGNLGLGQAGVAGQDYSRQLAAGQGIQGIGAANIQAAQQDASTRLGAAGRLESIGNTATDTGLRGVAALESAGQAQQNQTQANYNAGLSAFQQQQQYPWQQIGNASNVLQGLPVNTSSSGSSTTTQPGPSAVSQIAGVGLGVAGLANSGIFKAKGGAVRKKKTHSYGNVPRRGISMAMAA